MSDNTAKSKQKNNEKKISEPSTKRMRQLSSTSTEDTAIVINKSEQEDIIQKSIYHSQWKNTKVKQNVWLKIKPLNS